MGRRKARLRGGVALMGDLDVGIDGRGLCRWVLGLFDVLLKLCSDRSCMWSRCALYET
jgi:hypothetical protein